MGGWVGGWLDQLGLKLTQSPTGVWVGVGTELGKKSKDNLKRAKTTLKEYRKSKDDIKKSKKILR